MSMFFNERDLTDGININYKILKDLYYGESPYQKARVVETEAYGRMLILDDYVMLTESDEFVYHEMITHIPMCHHKDPRTIVVVGGGDGGTVRELVKYPSIEQIVLCEIDQLVIDVSKEFFPNVACALNHSKLKINVADGVAYIKSLKEFADIIIIDSTDPIGPGEGLFMGEFYQSVARALKPGGIMVCQSESPWYKKEFLLGLRQNLRTAFSHVEQIVGPVPTYPRGFWSWTLSSNSKESLQNFNKARFELVAKDLKFLTPVYAENAFKLVPPFYRQKVEA